MMDNETNFIESALKAYKAYMEYKVFETANGGYGIKGILDYKFGHEMSKFFDYQKEKELKKMNDNSEIESLEKLFHKLAGSIFDEMKLVNVYTGILSIFCVEQKDTTDFVKILKNIPDIKNARNIINVGSGQVSVEPVALKQIYGAANITAVDPEINVKIEHPGISYDKTEFLCSKAARLFNAHRIKKDTDLILGKPCTGVKHVVQHGVETDTPFIAALCGCEASDLNGRRFRNGYEQDGYLNRYPQTKIAKMYGSEREIITNMPLREEHFQLVSHPSNIGKKLTEGIKIGK